ncbi:MAG TPA: hypothetical protein VNR64_14300 [Vicinamibacterales bacterium]|jgi:hypothetical protein|nr:hypothetical protein [Vicinamibacterales bacterium]
MRTRAIVVVLLVAALGTAAAIGAVSWRGHRAAERFDPAVWRGSGTGYCLPSRRRAMVADVVAHRIHRGMPMRGVRDLLGAPDEVTRNGTWVFNVDREYGGLLSTCVTLALYPRAGRLGNAVVGRDD